MLWTVWIRQADKGWMELTPTCTEHAMEKLSDENAVNLLLFDSNQCRLFTMWAQWAVCGGLHKYSKSWNIWVGYLVIKLLCLQALLYYIARTHGQRWWDGEMERKSARIDGRWLCVWTRYALINNYTLVIGNRTVLGICYAWREMTAWATKNKCGGINVRGTTICF